MARSMVLFWVYTHHWEPERTSRRGTSSPATVATVAAAAAPDFFVKVAANLANLGLTPNVAEANAERILLVELLVLIVDVSEL